MKNSRSYLDDDEEIKSMTESRMSKSDQKGGGSEDGSSEDEEVDISIKQQELIFNPESSLRQWLKKRGKNEFIDFDDEELRQLRDYFNSLDDDGSGSIGVDELEGPLIALGLVENRQQVQDIVDLVDEDGSSMIEFGEFLSIIKGGSNAKEGNDVSGTGAIYQFFKKLTSGQLKLEENPNIPFQLFISGYRRRKILDAMMNKDKNKKDEGDKILNNYKKQITERTAREKVDKGEASGKTTANLTQKFGKRDSASKNNSVFDFGITSQNNNQQLESFEPEILLDILNGKFKKK
ncbi:ef hand family protein [Stylonychia lemnae]|uniref:Ef hand family protein n=1 Tax=Stylonychia lemnae TaxID=5949 RepID=A0A078ANB2_STYLE|nr:ef hand family protein [Stylonychia lemnae]|eukprot:CDW82832.1 ef hand family protein [Stylonychia lemnae]